MYGLCVQNAAQHLRIVKEHMKPVIFLPASGRITFNGREISMVQSPSRLTPKGAFTPYNALLIS